MNPFSEFPAFKKATCIVAVAGLIGCGGSQVAETINTFRVAEDHYLSQRFARAYQKESAEIAIWEGTNLVAWLDTNYTTITKEMTASRILLHSRLSVLLNEVGSAQEAKKHEAQAHKHFNLIVPGTSFTSDVVVSNTVHRDSLTYARMARLSLKQR